MCKAKIYQGRLCKLKDAGNGYCKRHQHLYQEEIRLKEQCEERMKYINEYRQKNGKEMFLENVRITEERFERIKNRVNCMKSDYIELEHNLEKIKKNIEVFERCLARDKKYFANELQDYISETDKSKTSSSSPIEPENVDIS